MTHSTFGTGKIISTEGDGGPYRTVIAEFPAPAGIQTVRAKAIKGIITAVES